MKHMIRHRPFFNFAWPSWEDFDRELEHVFGPHKWDLSEVEGSDWFPAIDIKEEEDKYIITADVPGVKIEDIEIHMEEGVLTIKGEKETEKKEEKENYRRIERAKGAFYRRFSLPDVDADKITARCVDGVLTITAPKTTKRIARKIAIEK
jgi:HSP20 family protein